MHWQEKQVLRLVLLYIACAVAIGAAYLWWYQPAHSEPRGIPGLQLPRNAPQAASLGSGRTFDARGCRVTGKTKGLHPTLYKRLCAMSRTLGPVNVVSGCRKHGSRRAPRSYHRISVGCKAADVTVSGARGSAILAYWARTGGGGMGSYRGRRFVHVDIGPNRTWRW